MGRDLGIHSKIVDGNIDDVRTMDKEAEKLLHEEGCGASKEFENVMACNILNALNDDPESIVEGIYGGNARFLFVASSNGATESVVLGKHASMHFLKTLIPRKEKLKLHQHIINPKPQEVPGLNHSCCISSTLYFTLARYGICS